MKLEVSVHDVVLHAEVVPMGEDFCVAVTGGDRPHLGSVALAVPHPGISDPACPSATVSTLNLPAHRDGDVANQMAKELSRSFGRPVAVLCGIHFDHVSPERIQHVRQAAAELNRAILSAYSSPDAS